MNTDCYAEIINEENVSKPFAQKKDMFDVVQADNCEILFIIRNF